MKQLEQNFNDGLPDLINAGVPLAGAIIGGAEGPGLGTAIGGGVGALAGTMIGGPLGAKLGQVAGGLIGGLIGKSGAERKRQGRLKQTMLTSNNQLNLVANDNPYGDVVSFYAEDGGMPAMAMTGDDNGYSTANIELDELVVDPTSLKVIQDFKNKSRFSKHAANKMKEPMGNFVEIPSASVVIPAKLADRYKSGNKLTKKSIIAEIIKNQVIDEEDRNGQYQEGGSPKISSGFGGITKTGKKAGTSVINAIAADKAKKAAASGKGTAKKPVTKPAVVTPLLGSNAATVKTNAATILELPNPIMTSKDVKIGTTPVTLQKIGYKPAGVNVMDIPSPYPGIPGEEYPIITNVSPVTEVNSDMDMRSQLALMDTGGLEGNPVANSKPDRESSKLKINPIDAAQAATLLPTMFGMIDAFKEDPNLLYTDNASYNQAQGIINAIPVDESVEAEKAALARGAAGLRQTLNNYGSPSVRAELASAYGTMQGQIGQVMANAKNNRAARIASKLGMLAGLTEREGGNKEAARVRFNTESSQDRAVRSGLIQSALSEGVTNSNQMVMDRERIKALNAMSMYFNLNPGEAETVTSDPNAMEAIINAIVGGVVPSLTTSTGKDTNINTNESSVSRDRFGRIRTTTNKKKETKIQKG